MLAIVCLLGLIVGILLVPLGSAIGSWLAQ